MWKIVKDARDEKEPAAIEGPSSLWQSFHMPEMVQHKKIVPFQTKLQHTPRAHT